MRVAEKDGHIVHRCDLGHAYHSKSSERFKVWVCNNLGYFVPVLRFTYRPQIEAIEKILCATGAQVVRIEYRRMQSLRLAMNKTDWTSTTSLGLAQSVTDLDSLVASELSPKLQMYGREKMFPSVAIMAKRL